MYPEQAHSINWIITFFTQHRRITTAIFLISKIITNLSSIQTDLVSHQILTTAGGLKGARARRWVWTKHWHQAVACTSGLHLRLAPQAPDNPSLRSPQLAKIVPAAGPVKAGASVGPRACWSVWGHRRNRYHCHRVTGISWSLQCWDKKFYMNRQNNLIN